MIPTIERNGTKTRVMVEVDLSGSMMEMESKIQDALNIAGNRLTKEALEQFDTNGQPLQFGDIKFTARQKTVKEYETPYGCVRVERYIYQTSKGGKTYCPLDAEARIIKNSTPRFAKIVSAKYVNHSAAGAKADLELSNGRDVSRCYIQDLAETVGTMASAVEDTMDYKIPKLNEPVTTVAYSDAIRSMIPI